MKDENPNSKSNDEKKSSTQTLKELDEVLKKGLSGTRKISGTLDKASKKENN